MWIVVISSLLLANQTLILWQEADVRHHTHMTNTRRIKKHGGHLCRMEFVAKPVSSVNNICIKRID